MDIKALMKDKKTLTIFGVAGAIAGFVVFLQNKGSNTNTQVVGKQDLNGVLQDQENQMQNQMQQSVSALAQQTQEQISQLNAQHQTELQTQSSQFESLLQSTNDKNNQTIQQLKDNFASQQQTYYNQISALTTQVNQAQARTNFSSSGGSGGSSTPADTRPVIHATGADAQILSQQYGNSIKIVDNGYTDSNLKGTDRVATNANAQSYLASQGVKASNNVSSASMWSLGGVYH